MQLDLFPNSPTPTTTHYQDIQKVRYDPYSDEITRQPEDTVLMVVDDDVTTISKRLPGDGTGRITERTISKNGKDYKQYWYDWQYYQNGKLVGRCKYIPKRLLTQIKAMDDQKLPVDKILGVLLGRES